MILKCSVIDNLKWFEEELHRVLTQFTKIQKEREMKLIEDFENKQLQENNKFSIVVQKIDNVLIKSEAV